jgi:hypothetical protein
MPGGRGSEKASFRLLLSSVLARQMTGGLLAVCATGSKQAIGLLVLP